MSQNIKKFIWIISVLCVSSIFANSLNSNKETTFYGEINFCKDEAGGGLCIQNSQEKKHIVYFFDDETHVEEIKKYEGYSHCILTGSLDEFQYGFDLSKPFKINCH